MKKKIHNLYIFLSLSFMLLLTGCASDQEIYESITDGSFGNVQGGLEKFNIFTPENWLALVNKFKWWVPLIITISFAFAVVLSALFKNVKAVKKKVIVIFGILIPSIAFFSVYIVAYMYRHLF